MRAVTPLSRTCSSVVKRCSSPQTMTGSAATFQSPGKPFMRKTVACSSESGPTTPISCFGNCSRDMGHRRVPDPPARMTGTSERQGSANLAEPAPAPTPLS